MLCTYIQPFRERLSEKMCTRQSRKVIWDMFNTLFLTLQQSNLLLLLSLSTRRHMSMASPAILSSFFQKPVNSRPPKIPCWVVECTLSDYLPRNSCICVCLAYVFVWNGRMRRKWSHSWEKTHKIGKIASIRGKKSHVSCHNFEKKWPTTGMRTVWSSALLYDIICFTWDK